VVGRYLFGLSFLASDEVQVFIMVAMTFIGAVVVTRRNMHLRMDVLVKFMPRSVQIALRVTEQLLFIALTAFVLTQSFDYAQRMFQIGRVSDMAGVPMWIPHATVLIGFGLMLLVAAWRLVGVVRPAPQQPDRGEAKP
jgi:C4-dicarboxylate transporter DctQ subunit